MMKKRIPLLLVGSIIILGVLILPTHAPAAKENFSQWLKDLDAWDAFAREMARQNPTQESVLAQSEALIKSGNPEQALELLNSFGTFKDDLEGKRLWLRGQALRQMEEYPEAVLDFSAACDHLSPAQSLENLRREPRLEHLWDMVWTKWFWEMWMNPDQDMIRARTPILDRALDLATQAWPKSSRWQAIEKVWVLQPFASETVHDDLNNEQKFLIQALAAWSVGLWDLGRNFISQIGTPERSSFWLHFGNFLEKGRLEPTDQDAPVKARVFRSAYNDTLQSMQSWFLDAPAESSWGHFMNHLKTLSPSQALELVVREKASSLLSSEIKSSLIELEKVLTIVDGDLGPLYATTSQEQKTLCMKLAWILAQQDFSSEFKDMDQRLVMLSLANAGGFTASAALQAPFWIESKNESWPLDPLLLYRQLAESPEDDMRAAGMLAFLYPQSPEGQKAFLRLAREAHAHGRFELAWKYIQNIRQENADNPDWNRSYLLARAGLEMEQGMETQALATYTKVLELDPEAVPWDKKVKLALLAQRQGKWQWAQGILEDVWEERSKIKPELQAETLFWLGEGAQYLGDDLKALDYYLRLAWGYPEQNIWALTALYRAGLIYEKQEKYQSAASLYTKVLKQSDRKSQKEAAEQRIQALEKKTGQGFSENTPLF